MAARPNNNSGPYWFIYLIVVFLVGGLMITAINPFWDGAEDSKIFEFDTKWGQDLAMWFTEFHAFVGLIGLLAIVYTAYIVTREPE